MTDVTARAGVRSPTRVTDAAVAATLLAGALVGWWWSVRMAGDMGAMGPREPMVMPMSASMSMAAFVLGWVAMMAAMMFPAVFPAVRLYARAAARGTVAPLPFFVGGYLLVWSSVGIPAYFAWRGLADPLDAGVHWAARLAGAVLLGAAVYQLSPLKRACLQHCRSPLSLFTRASGNATRPSVALRLGATHGAFCLGCCWALMAVLVAVGTMQLAWMAGLALVIFVEKVVPRGETFAVAAALALAAVGTVLLLDPQTLTTFT